MSVLTLDVSAVNRIAIHSMYVSEVRLKFTPNIRLLCICIFLLPTLVVLGFWQLARAEEKEVLLENYQLKGKMAAQDYKQLVTHGAAKKSNKNIEYRQVSVTGHYVADTNWWLENRIKLGQPGFHVLSLFKLEGGTTVVVNRGWIAAKGHRQELPVIDTPLELTTVSGILVVPKKHPLLSYMPEVINGQKVIATVDIETMAAEVKEKIEPYLVYAEQQEGSGLLQDWPIYATKPEKHRGYAAQWFLMAFVLLIFCVYANTNISSWITFKRKGLML